MQFEFKKILKKLDLRIVAGFLIVSIVLVTPIVYMLLRPLDGIELKNHVQSLGTAVSEAKELINDKNRTGKIYFKVQFEDLSGNITQTQEITEHTAYKKDIKKQRDQYLEVAQNLAQEFHSISLSYDDSSQLNKSMKELLDTEKEINNLSGQL